MPEACWSGHLRKDSKELKPERELGIAEVKMTARTSSDAGGRTEEAERGAQGGERMPCVRGWVHAAADNHGETGAQRERSPFSYETSFLFHPNTMLHLFSLTREPSSIHCRSSYVD